MGLASLYDIIFDYNIKMYYIKLYSLVLTDLILYKLYKYNKLDH